MKDYVDTTKKLQLLSFCTGYGGIERGLELAGVSFRTITHVEIEAFAIANLVAKMEEGRMVSAPIWTNVKTLPLEVFRDRVDILTGGYPCQPFSAAGQRKGSEDPRHLWPHILRAIDVIRPRRVFFENVEGHISLGLQEVIESLEIRGYKTAWGIFSASEVGAPHQRKRVFILANSCIEGSERCRSSDPTIKSGEATKRPITERCSNGTQWPARPGYEQNPSEAPRTIPFREEKIKPRLGGAVDGTRNRVDRLRLLGNGVVPQTAALAWQVLSERLEDESIHSREG